MKKYIYEDKKNNIKVKCILDEAFQAEKLSPSNRLTK